ncbi:uncharacterized protein BDV14DRAFT_199287 [Aspergillus stella-maris]|uniref:uncharacterized protein n=1 Tax=Aspergillus stella-maris TaxID=1810926 RepID=UPI003CCE18A3
MGITEGEEDQGRWQGKDGYNAWTMDIHDRLLSGFEEDTYDSDFLGEEDFAWLGRTVALVPSSRRWLECRCEHGHDHEHDHEDCAERDDCDCDGGRDPYWPSHNTEVSCFTGAYLIYPFHEDCLDIFCRAMHGTPDRHLMDMHALEEAINKFRYTDNGLRLDYGDINGPRQIWRCHPGEGYASIKTSSQKSRRPCAVHNPALDLSNKVRDDPFASLPPEILDMMLAYLPTSALAPARLASWALYKSPQSRILWKQRISTDLIEI